MPTKNRIDADTRAIIEGLKKQQAQGDLRHQQGRRGASARRCSTLAAELNAALPFEHIFMISAETGDGVEDLMTEVVAHLPEGPHHFPDDQLTDLPVRLLAAEVTREHLFRQLHEEVPYALTVETEAWEEFKDGSAKVSQVVYVARDNQKAIVLGKGGSRIKQVREAAQAELIEMLERKVHLFLFVKVRENWQEDPERYREMGLDFES